MSRECCWVYFEFCSCTWKAIFVRCAACDHAAGLASSATQQKESNTATLCMHMFLLCEVIPAKAFAPAVMLDACIALLMGEAMFFM